MLGAEYDLSPAGALAMAGGLLCLSFAAIAFLLLCMGIGRPRCRQCGLPVPAFVKAVNRREWFFGGWTCKECGYENGIWGLPVRQQNPLAKWAVLGSIDHPQEQRPRQKPHDKRIRPADDQTTPGSPS